MLGIIGIIAFAIVIDIINGGGFFAQFSRSFGKTALVGILLIAIFTNAPGTLYAHAADIEPNAVLTEMELFMAKLFFVY